MTSGNRSGRGDDNDNSIERAFQLLEEARSVESSGDYWTATKKFVEAHEVLNHLAVTSPRLTDDEMKTVELFQGKSLEYFHRSRQCFIDALRTEKTVDEQRKESTTSTDDVKTLVAVDDGNKKDEDGLPIAPDAPPSRSTKNKSFTYSNLDDEEAKTRIETFITLFSKPVASMMPTMNMNNNNDTEDGQNGSFVEHEKKPQSLEERLAALNESLPSVYKTADERLEEINRTMNKLGLSVYPQSKPFSRFEDHHQEKSEDEQIDEILAMAQDQAGLAKQLQQEKQDSRGRENIPSTSDVDVECNDDDIDSDDDDDEVGDELVLDDCQLAVMKIRRRVVKAQAKISKLVALLDQAESSLKEEDVEEEEKIRRGTNGDDDSIDSIPKVPAEFFLASGKKQLKEAHKDLRKALQRWNDELDG